MKKSEAIEGQEKGLVMKLDELFIKRRSVRKYRDRNVPVEVIRELINESTLAPNAGNEQPWKFIIVNDKELLKRISDESKKNILARIASNSNDYAKKYEGMLRNKALNVFYNAPCLVMILGSSHLKNLYVDCALAASYFMMGATARGLATCWVNLGIEIHDPRMIDELGIPEDCTIVAPIIVGYPEKIPRIPKMKEPEILRIIAQ
jgi:nitroreductase